MFVGDMDSGIQGTLSKFTDDNKLKIFKVLREPTWKDALLDLLLVNGQDLVREVETGGRLGHSDHEVIKFNISVEGGKVPAKSQHEKSRFQAAQAINNRPRGSQCPELEDHDCENDQRPVNPEIVRDLLLQLDPYKTMGPDGIHPRILKELSDVIAKSL
ncbi:hypothetical protein BTVI_147035 [Pitangus sulphuratus]|nr:hypothetical protein BTVI_147035 [Pitangus sulphuratus]